MAQRKHNGASGGGGNGGGCLSDAEKLDWLRLIRTENVGPVTFHELIAHFGSARAALDAIPGLRARGGMRRPGQVCPERQAAQEMQAAARAGVRIIAYPEPDYPPLLRHIDAAPPLIFALGDAGLAARDGVGIVGSRSASGAGRQLTGTLARDLGAAGVVVVSGLARGIDTAAHLAALDTGTIAVVAGGVDVIYPPENAELHAGLAARGLIVSECPLGYNPRGQDFPRRNRIISGLSLGVAVVEAAHQSGSLITARLALEQNREVFAVPGHPLDPRAAGTNALIRSGARLITCAGDILAELRLGELPLDRFPPGVRENTYDRADTAYSDARPAFTAAPMAASDDAGDVRDDYPHADTRRDAPHRDLPYYDAPHNENPRNSSSADRDKLLQALSFAPVSADILARSAGLSASAVAVALLELDLAGRIERHSNHCISLRTD